MPSSLELIRQGLVGTWDVLRVFDPPEMGTVELREDGTFAWWWDETGTSPLGNLLVPRGEWGVLEGPRLQLFNFEQPPNVFVVLPRVLRILEMNPPVRMASLTPVQEYVWHRRSR